MIDWESDQPTRWIREAMHIQKEGQRAMIRDEGSYQLSQAYDHFPEKTVNRHIKSQKDWVSTSSDEGLWSQRQGK